MDENLFQVGTRVVTRKDGEHGVILSINANDMCCIQADSKAWQIWRFCYELDVEDFLDTLARCS